MNQITLSRLAAVLLCLVCFFPFTGFGQPIEFTKERPGALVNRYINTANLYMKLGSMRDTLEAAMAILRVGKTTADSNYMAIGYYMLGNDEILHHRGAQAHAMIQKGFNYVRHDTIIGALWQLDEQLAADLLNDLHRAQASGKKSIEHYEKARQYHEALKTYLNQVYTFQRFNQCSRGKLQLDFARKYYLRHEEFIRKTVSPQKLEGLKNELKYFGAYLESLCYTCKADSLTLIGKTDSAQANYRAARNTLMEFKGFPYPHHRGVINHTLARVQLGLAESKFEIAQTLDRARAAFNEAGDNQEESIAILFQAYLSISEEQWADTTLFLQGLGELLGYTVGSLFENPDAEYFTRPDRLNLYYLSRAYFLKAEVLRFLFDENKDPAYLQQRLATLRTALDIAQAQRLIVTEDEALYAINFRAAQLYRQAVETAVTLVQLAEASSAKVRAARIADAWELAQRSKEFTLRQAARQYGAIPYPAELQSIATTYSEKQERVRSSYHDYLLAANPDEANTLKAAHQKAQADFKNYIQKLALGTPEERRFYRERYEDFFAAPDTVIAMLAPGQTLLEYYFLPQNKQLAVFIGTPGEALRFQLLDAGSDIAALCKSIQDRLAQGADSNLVSLVLATNRLYRIVLEPLRDQIRGDRLLICPDRALATIPFEALVDTLPDLNRQSALRAPQNYLVRDYAITYDYSASMHYVSTTVDYTDRVYQYNWVGFAPFHEAIPPGLLAPLSPRMRTMAQDTLQYSRNEVVVVDKLMAGMKTTGLPNKLFLDAGASRRTFWQYCSLGRFLHLSTHGVSDNQNPDFSFVLFYPNGSDDSSAVYVRDIYQIAIPVEMAVLSACETLAGSWAEGEGLFSLNRAFTFAGAKAVVASRWQAEDKTIAATLEWLYRNMLKSGMTKDRALRSAVLDMSEGKHPHFWAGINMIGDSGN